MDCSEFIRIARTKGLDEVSQILDDIDLERNELQCHIQKDSQIDVSKMESKE